MGGRWICESQIGTCPLASVSSAAEDTAFIRMLRLCFYRDRKAETGQTSVPHLILSGYTDLYLYIFAT